jgi:MoxR-like ATPase
MLAKTLARSIDCSVRRVQFTPDLLPSDITGVSVFNQDVRDFEFRPGAIFANVVVGDEINRASPKTQSALLECMEERQVTVDGQTYTLPRPFIVILEAFFRQSFVVHRARGLRVQRKFELPVPVEAVARP